MVCWFRLAAEQGHRNAQYILRSIYANGEGVPEDYVLGCMWANLAGDRGHPFARGTTTSKSG